MSRWVAVVIVLFSAVTARAADKPFILAQKGGADEHLLHLPGIAGARSLDREFVRGLRDGGYPGTLDIYDWTDRDPGLAALVSRQRNEKQAHSIAKMIEDLLLKNPKLKIRITAHSGGTGIAAWALERLPDDVKIESLVLIAPALSQKYDLSKALSHVRGKAFAFTSEHDSIVLGAGTRLFGTIDGLKEEAAGYRGFTKPAGADDEQYEKLIAMPYNAGWMSWDNNGDHIGPMMRPFARTVISPIVQDREPPATQPAPKLRAAATTRPATQSKK